MAFAGKLELRSGRPLKMPEDLMQEWPSLLVKEQDGAFQESSRDGMRSRRNFSS